MEIEYTHFKPSSIFAVQSLFEDGKIYYKGSTSFKKAVYNPIVSERMLMHHLSRDNLYLEDDKTDYNRIDTVLKTFVDSSCTLDKYFNFDSGDYNSNNYIFIPKNEVDVIAEHDEELGTIYESDLFAVFTSPNINEYLVVNKGYRYED